VDGLNGAFESETDADFLKGQIRLLGDEGPQFAAVGIEDDGLTTAAMMERSDVSGMAALVEKLFDQAEGDLESRGDLFAGDVTAIIGLEDALPQIHGNRCHGETVAGIQDKAMLLFKLL